MSQLLLSAINGDVVGAAKKVRGPVSVLLEGTIGASTTTILVGRVGETRVPYTYFDIDDDNVANLLSGRGRIRRIDLLGDFDISATINGTGDHVISVSIFH